MTARIAAEQAYGIGLDPFTTPAATHTLGHVPGRARVVVEGTVRAVTHVNWVGGPATEIVLGDGTGTLTLVFFGGRGVAGIERGRRLVAAGIVGSHRGEKVILSPQLWLLPVRVREVVDIGTLDALVPALAGF